MWRGRLTCICREDGFGPHQQVSIQVSDAEAEAETEAELNNSHTRFFTPTSSSSLSQYLLLPDDDDDGDAMGETKTVSIRALPVFWPKLPVASGNL